MIKTPPLNDRSMKHPRDYQPEETLIAPKLWIGSSTIRSKVEEIVAPLTGTVALAGILLIVAAFMRLSFLGADPPYYEYIPSGSFATDEGIWSFMARRWAEHESAFQGGENLTGSLSLPYTIAQYATFVTFGIGIVPARLSCALLGSLLPVLVFLIGRNVFGTRQAFWMGLLISTNLLLVMYQRTGMVDSWMTCWITLAFVTWELALVSTKLRTAVAAGVLTGIALWSKVTALPFLAAVVISGLWGLTTRKASHLPRQLRGFTCGLVSVGILAVFVYSSSSELTAAALETLAVNPNKPADTLIGWLWHARGILFDNPFNTFMPFVTLAGCGSLLALAIALVRKHPLPCSLCAGIWISLACLMLAIHGYAPPRYYLQLVPAIVVVAVQGASFLWNKPMASSRFVRPIRTALFLLLLPGLLLPLKRFSTWFVDRQYSQREVGREIEAQLPSGVEKSRIAGRWSFNLALAGDFQPMGFYGAGRPWLQRALSNGATHFLYQGKLSQHHRRVLADLGFTARKLSSFTYLKNYHGNKAQLELYQVFPRNLGASETTMAETSTMDVEKSAPK